MRRGCEGRGGGPARRMYRLLPTAGILILAAPLLLSGCFGVDHTAGDPVAKYHYNHTITVTGDFSSISIQTYISRTQWQVGLQRQDLYDGDRDGTLTTPGMDRVAITDYIDIEDPTSQAVRRIGELRDYDELFQRIIAAAKAGKENIEIEDRRHDFRFISKNLQAASPHAFG